MATRRDQLHSYQFIFRRVSSALIVHEPDTEHLPFRRLGGAVFGGLMVAILIAAAFGVYGLFKPGGNASWKKKDAIIVEKETGAVYVYRGSKLHPVLNYTSALLIAAQGNASATEVSRGSLRGAPRGSVLGIPNAPASLPEAGQVLGTPWVLCSTPDQNKAGQPITASVLTVGQKPAHAHTLGDAGLLAKDAGTGQLYLVWHQHRYAIPKPDIVLGAMVWSSAPQISVASAWLDALPAGQDLVVPTVPSPGGESSAVSGAKIGEVFVVHGSHTEQYYVALADALAPLTELQAGLLLGDPAMSSANDGRQAAELSPAAAASARHDTSLRPGDSEATPPSTPPDLARDDDVDKGAICAAYQGSGAAPKVMVGSSADTSNGVPTHGQTKKGVSLADRIMVPTGQVAIVQGVGAKDAPAGGLNLVTDQGLRYPIPSDDVLSMLGYDSVKPESLPASLVARIPAGPALDPDRAKKAARGR